MSCFILLDKENTKTYSRHKETQTQTTPIPADENSTVSEVLVDIKEEPVEMNVSEVESNAEIPPVPSDTVAGDTTDVVMDADGGESTLFMCPICGEMFTANEDTLRIHLGCHREGVLFRLPIWRSR